MWVTPACWSHTENDRHGQVGQGEGLKHPHPQYLLQFSSSLPSGQSSNPLHLKRPMIQWMPLAQGKNVGPHLDLALAAGGKEDKEQNIRSSSEATAHSSHSECAVCSGSP